MKKVYLISVQFRHKGEVIKQFLPKVFFTEKLAKKYFEYINKYASKDKTYAVIQTDMYVEMEYIDKICIF